MVTPNVRYNEVVEDGIVAGNVLPADFKPTKAGLARVRENIIKAGIVGRLVANDFSGALVSARLQEFHPNTGERLDYLEVARALEVIRRDAEAGGVADVHIIGFAKVVGEIADGAAQVLLFFGLAVVITALFVYAYTRSVRLTAMPLACSLVAVVWQLGALTGLGFGVDPMSILVPFSGLRHRGEPRGADGERGGGRRRRAASRAARASFRRLLLPGSVALASDAIGFVAIALIPVRVIQEIAVTASLGVAAIILTNLGLLPVALSFLKPGEGGGRAGLTGHGDSWRVSGSAPRGRPGRAPPSRR